MEKIEETVVWIGRSSSGAKIPEYKSKRAEAMDISASGRCIIFPQQKIIVPTNLVIAIQALTSMEIRPRSGMSWKSPLEIPNSPGTIDQDYRDDIGVIIANRSLPNYEHYVDGSYTKFFTYLAENGMKNGNLSEEDLVKLKETFEEIISIEEAKENRPGIYVINPGDRIAQITLKNNSRIVWETEKFLSKEKEQKMIADGLTDNQIEAEKETIRKNHLAKVKKMGYNRGGGFGQSGVR